MQTSQIIRQIVKRFQQQGYAQVPGYNRFDYVGKGESYVIISRENGNDTKIPFSKLAESIEAVRKDFRVYSEGPSKLRQYGITHITSPLWALLHLCTLEELTA